MVVIIKSAPDTTEAKRAVKLARDMAGSLLLIQNGVYFAQNDALEGFCGKAYVLIEDCQLRGLQDNELKKDIVKIDYDALVDLITENDKVIGAF